MRREIDIRIESKTKVTENVIYISFPIFLSILFSSFNLILSEFCFSLFYFRFLKVFFGYLLISSSFLSYFILFYFMLFLGQSCYWCNMQPSRKIRRIIYTTIFNRHYWFSRGIYPIFRRDFGGHYFRMVECSEKSEFEKKFEEWLNE